jgi:hypothetical protein
MRRRCGHTFSLVDVTGASETVLREERLEFVTRYVTSTSFGGTPGAFLDAAT